MSLNKRDIEKWIKFEFYFSGAKCKKIVNTLIEILMRTLESGEDVLISGFGKFCVKEKAERKGRNPTTGESIILPPRRVVTFKCSPKLKDKIERTHFLATFGVNPQEIFQLFDFANQITPPNWIFYEYRNRPELKPGNLYIEVLPMRSDATDWEEEKEALAFVSGPMMFQKISDVANRGSEREIKVLKKYGDGSFAHIGIEIRVNNFFEDRKWVMVHELAHVLVTRRAAQKWHIWNTPCGIVPNTGEDTSPHGPIFQCAYKLFIERVKKIDKMVAEKCLNNLFYYENEILK